METLFFKPTGRYDQQVVGESHYQTHLAYLAEQNDDRLIESVDLFLDDHNRHDSNAVAVSVDGEDVGHLSKTDALRYRQALKSLGHPAAIGVCRGILTGGHDLPEGVRASYGIVLDLDLDDLQIEEIASTKKASVTAAASRSLPNTVKKPNKLLLGCLAAFGLACLIFVCSAALSGAFAAINTTPTAGSIVTSPPSLPTPTRLAQPAQIGKPPEEYLAEYGGNLEVYQNILSLTDCALLQEQFDQASANNARETAGTPQFQWTLGYMLAADERMQSLGCY